MEKGHSGHSHGVTPDADKGALALALALILGFMLVEVVVGFIASSLALLSDAAHMLTDAGALALALFAIRLAARPAAGGFTFGFKRAEILSAQFNGAVLLALGAVITYDAIGRLVDPPEVDAVLVIPVGVLGALVNLGAQWSLARAERRSLNVEGAMQHILTDLYASLGAIVAGLVILLTGFNRADPMAAMFVAGLMFWAAYRLLRDSGRVLLEAAPAGTSPDEIGRAMAAHSGVAEVHDLHVWEVTTGFPALSAHVTVPAGDDCHARRRELAQLLADRFQIDHVTLQVEHERRHELLDIEAAPPGDELGPTARSNSSAYTNIR